MKVKMKKTNKEINLTKNNFVGAGGEGKIFVKGETAYKIYIDRKKVIHPSKIDELSLITDKNVIKPKDIILNQSNNIIGYSMKYIKNTYTLCQLFPRIFRDREGFNNDMALKLVLRLRKMIENIHKADILVVDMNEMNFLVDKKFKNIYAIDVDSYQTYSFPATAIMESIRDRHSSSFSQLTDWFSFGIISFQIFTSIHPFKGRHPSIRYPQDKGREITERMLQNIPVFHKDIRYPGNVLPFDIIPQTYQDWFKAVFYDGKRMAPPSDAVEVIIIPTVIKSVASDKDFDITEVFVYPANLIEYLSVDGIRIATLKNDDIYLNAAKIQGLIGQEIAITAQNDVICGDIYDHQLKLQSINHCKDIPCTIAAEETMSYNGRLFIKNADAFSEIQFVKMGDNIQAVPQIVANVMENATQVFPGTVLQNMLGRFMVSVFPSKGLHYQINVEELDGYKIIDAKYDNKVLFVIGVKNGKYDKFIFKFDDNFSQYSLRKEQNINYCGINFVVIDNGVVVHINEAEDLELFSNKKDATTVRVIDSDTIDGNMRLFKDGVNVLFSKGKKLYKMKMR